MRIVRLRWPNLLGRSVEVKALPLEKLILVVGVGRFPM
jgi:hypothetical protein